MIRKPILAKEVILSGKNISLDEKKIILRCKRLNRVTVTVLYSLQESISEISLTLYTLLQINIKQ